MCRLRFFCGCCGRQNAQGVLWKGRVRPRDGADPRDTQLSARTGKPPHVHRGRLPICQESRVRKLVGCSQNSSFSASEPSQRDPSGRTFRVGCFQPGNAWRGQRSLCGYRFGHTQGAGGGLQRFDRCWSGRAAAERHRGWRTSRGPSRAITRARGPCRNPPPLRGLGVPPRGVGGCRCRYAC